MALPASGTISFSDINVELNFASSATCSLQGRTAQTAPNINQAAPYSVSEFYSHAQNTVTLEPGSRIVVGTNGTTAAFDVTTTEAWTISDDQTWATPDKSAGTGNDTVTYTLTENNGGTTRFAVVTVVITGDDDTSSIAQQSI